MDYQMEELLPLVSELAQKYSGYESTSITYEKAQTLMGAVLYCLEEYQRGQAGGLVPNNIPIKEQYDTGARLIYEKAKNIQKICNELSLSFESYGVKCLYDTVQKDIPHFLKWYDVKYNPQDTIITLDYPLFIDCSSLSGADAVYQYILAIQTEQRFLEAFDKEYVLSVLRNYNPQYEYMVENICDVVLTHIIGHAAMKKPFSEIEEFINQAIQKIVNELFETDRAKISEYLHCGAGNIAIRIKSRQNTKEDLGGVFYE